MIERLIDRNLNFLKKHILCDDDTVEVYRYSLRIIYSYIMDVLVLMSLAIVFNKVVETIIMLFTFAVLQVYGGGYHAKTQLGCMTIMVIGWFVGVFGWQRIVALNWCVSMALMVVFTVLVFKFTPVLNEKHPVSGEVYKRSRKIVRIVALVLDAVVLINNILNSSLINKSILTVQTLYCFSILACVINRIKNNKNEYNF